VLWPARLLDAHAKRGHLGALSGGGVACAGGGCGADGGGGRVERAQAHVASGLA